MPYLPDDLLLNCLARVSILYYPTLSLVSKRFRSLLASTELYKNRRFIGSTESCPYVSLRFADSRNPRWFTLSRGPSRIPKPRWFTLSGGPTRIPRWLTCCFSPCRIITRNFMISVPSEEFSTPSGWKPATIGSSIYMIGGYMNSELSSRVFIMDCVSHTWREAPSMQVARRDPCVSVVDGKIYVVECCKDYNSSNFMEFFNPETQIWEHTPIPGAETGIHGKNIYGSFAYQGNLYVIGRDNTRVVYKPKENKWEAVIGLINGIHFSGRDIYSSCMIDNILYSYKGAPSRRLEWYDSEGGSWRVLEGLKDLPKLPKIYLRVNLGTYDGKLVVFWEEDIRHKKKLIWCAEIAIERPKEYEVYGKVKWCDVVLTVPKSCSFYQLVLPTV